MRELKFRGWWADPQIMVEFGLGQDYFKGCFSHVDNECYTCEIEFADSIMQYTGLLDKNGKEIYEGDVIKLSYPLYTNKIESIYEIYWDERGLYVLRRNRKDNSENDWPTREDGMVYTSLDFNDGFEIIGNIHENPNLLD